MGWHSEGEGACGESVECVWVPEVGPGRYRSEVARRAREAQSGEQKERKCQGRVTIPYIQSVSEEFRRVLGSVNKTTHFRPPGTLRQVLFHPKNKVPKGKKTNVVYQAECGQCGEKYVGETQQPGDRTQRSWTTCV